MVARRGGKPRNCQKLLIVADPNAASMHGDTPADDTDLNDVPDSLMCPITHSIFNEPVMVVESGHTYEKRAIEEHFRHNGYKDPLTNRRLEHRETRPNWVVKKLVEEYVARNSRLNVTPNRPDSPLQPARGVAVLQADYALALQLQTEYDEEAEADSARTEAVNREEAPRRGHAPLLDPGLDELWRALPNEISDSQEPLERATPRADEISDNQEPVEPASDEETPQVCAERAAAVGRLKGQQEEIEKRIKLLNGAMSSYKWRTG